MARKHANIEQIDGFISENDDWDKYESCRHYWKHGHIGTVYQSFLDAVDIIENSKLTEESKQEEKEKVVEARRKAFGSNFKHFPPWSKM